VSAGKHGGREGSCGLLVSDAPSRIDCDGKISMSQGRDAEGRCEAMMDKADERRFLRTFVSIIVLAMLFTALAHAWPEIMPWHRSEARHIR
jgi:hypothetical protein